MQAAIVSSYGGPEVLSVQEVTRPTPKANEILVRVHASSATQAEAMMRKGTPWFGRLMLGLTKPKHSIPGTGFSGTVAAVGSDVSGFKQGDAVFGETAITMGANAEYVCVPSDGLILPKPETIKHEEAATLSDGALTSMNFLQNLAELKADQHILIIGASGSLGIAAVQLAKAMGAKVTGVCSAANVDMVRKLGADEVINYQESDYTKSAVTYDVVYDTIGAGSFKNCKGILSDTGRYISPVLSFKLLVEMLKTSKSKGKRAMFSATGMLSVAELIPLMQQVVDYINNKQLKVVIDKVYPLSKIGEAHAYIDTGRKKGNVVISSFS